MRVARDHTTPRISNARQSNTTLAEYYESHSISNSENPLNKSSYPVHSPKNTRTLSSAVKTDSKSGIKISATIDGRKTRADKYSSQREMQQKRKYRNEQMTRGTMSDSCVSPPILGHSTDG